jgi:hypothetical protein
MMMDFFDVRVLLRRVLSLSAVGEDGLEVEVSFVSNEQGSVADEGAEGCVFVLRQSQTAHCIHLVV